MAEQNTTPASELDILKAEIAKLKAKNELLEKSGKGKLTLKVSEKGGLSVYGLGRFPVTLYKGQWEKLIEACDSIKAFMAANDDKLSEKS